MASLPHKVNKFFLLHKFSKLSAASMLAQHLSRSSCENFIIGEFNRRDEIGIESACKTIHCLRVGMYLARVFITEDEVVQKMIRIFFFLQGCVKKSIWFVLTDIINKFADGLLTDFQRIIAHDKVGGLVNRHGAPPIMWIIRLRGVSLRVLTRAKLQHGG